MDIRDYISTLTIDTPGEFSNYFYEGWGDEITECREDILFWVQYDNDTSVYDDYKELDEDDEEHYNIHETLASIIGWEQDQEWMDDEMKLWRKSQRLNWWWQLCDEAVASWLDYKGVTYDDEDDKCLDLLHELSLFLHHFDNGYGYPYNMTGANLNQLSQQRITKMCEDV